MKKKIMAELDRCYSIAPLTYRNRSHILVASETADRCLLFDSEGELEATVWQGPGGVMTMAQVPGSDGVFLATNKFYSPNDSASAKLVTASPVGDMKWEVRTLTDLPFVHRFDIYNINGVNHLIACTLKSDHKYEDDLTSPGKVYTALLPDDLSQFSDENQLQLTVLQDGLHKNHGYTRFMQNGIPTAIVGCDEGVFQFIPPSDREGQWQKKQLLNTPASDALLIDLDGDGKEELVVISPFHGDGLAIYRQGASGFELDWQYPERADFLHGIWGGKLLGRPVAALGHRGGARRLILLLWDGEKKGFTFKTIDDDCGPANLYGFTQNGVSRLVAANRETNEIAMYIFDDLSR